MPSSALPDLLQSPGNGGKSVPGGERSEAKGYISMRIPLLLICGALAACTSGVTVPDDGTVTEVPQTGIASSAGGDSFGNPTPVTVEGSGLTTTLTPSANGTGPALDQDRINLMQWTLAQQKIDAAKAQRDLDAAKAQLVIYKPTGSVPQGSGPNVALYAIQSTNSVGQSIYPRSAAARLTSVGGCGRYRDPDSAQRAFLAAGGPQEDRLGLDPDGDGFACKFDPAVYRALN
jgi:hypothetical protein